MARILLVDDDFLTLAALSLFLRQQGHQVITAASVAEARRAAAPGAIDALLTDLSLPDGQGDELVPIFRVPSIAMTGLDGTEHRQRSARAGFALHLVKPVELDELAEVLQRWTGGSTPAP